MESYFDDPYLYGSRVRGFDFPIWGPIHDGLCNRAPATHGVFDWADSDTLRGYSEGSYWQDRPFEYQYMAPLPHRSRYDHEASSSPERPTGTAGHTRARSDNISGSYIYAYSLRRDIPTDGFHNPNTQPSGPTQEAFVEELQNEEDGIQHQHRRRERTEMSSPHSKHRTPSPEPRCETVYSDSASPQASPKPLDKPPIFTNPFIKSSSPNSPVLTPSRTSSVRSPGTPLSAGAGAPADPFRRAWKRLRREHQRLVRHRSAWETAFLRQQTALEIRERLLRAKEKELERQGERRSEWNGRAGYRDEGRGWWDLGILESD